jgi:LDH2 family malate/lactate/ureidoglycolate dehydrogenase
MATSVYLSNPVVTINSVALTDQCTSATVNYVYEQLETTTFGDTARKFGGAAVTSLQNNSIEVELFQSYAGSETEDTIFGLVGITTDIIVAPASGSASATNPIYTLTGCYLESHTPINAIAWRIVDYHVDV